MKNINKIKRNLAAVFSVISLVVILAVSVCAQKSQEMYSKNVKSDNCECYDYHLFASAEKKNNIDKSESVFLKLCSTEILEKNESKIENWMIDNNFWELSDEEVFNSNECELEDWMLDDNSWKLTEKFEWDNINESEIEIENWMLTLSLEKEEIEKEENSEIFFQIL